MSSKYGDRLDNLKLAVSFFKSHKIFVEKMSSYYETFSYPDKSKPKFINMIVLVKTKLSAESLMSSLIAIEEKLERKRDKKNDPRTCDIDIIDYNNEVLNFKYKDLHLEIPHKHLSSRNFVLFPLQEILPNWKHPKTGEIVSALIQELPEEDRKSILKLKKN